MQNCQNFSPISRGMPMLSIKNATGKVRCINESQYFKYLSASCSLLSICICLVTRPNSIYSWLDGYCVAWFSKNWHWWSLETPSKPISVTTNSVGLRSAIASHVNAVVLAHVACSRRLPSGAVICNWKSAEKFFTKKTDVRSKADESWLGSNLGKINLSCGMVLSDRIFCSWQ